MSNKLFRSIVNWTGIVVLVHLMAMIVFGIALSSTFSSMAYENRYSTSPYILVFSLACMLLFTAIYEKAISSFSEFNTALKISSKEPGFTFTSCFKAQLPELLWKCGVYAVFQLPFVIFYAVAGLDFVNATGLEKYYIMDAGFFALTGSALLGWLLNILLFTALMLGFRWISLKRGLS